MPNALNLSDALSTFADQDARVASILAEHGFPEERHLPPDMKGLARIVVDQMVSVAAGKAIWTRLEENVGDLHAASLVAAGPEILRQSGISRAKVSTLLALAEAEISGALCFSTLRDSDDGTVRDRLTQLPGIGPWTADIFLMFALKRPDIWPDGDLALRVACQWFFNLPTRPETVEMIALSEGWKPYRSAMALLLWKYYGNTKKSASIPEKPQ